MRQSPPVRAIIGTAFLLCCALTLPTGAGAQNPARRVTLRATVTHQGAPVAAATVRAGLLGAMTGDSGVALLQLAPGPHRIIAARIGFTPDTLDLVLTVDTAIVIALEAATEEIKAVVVASTRGDRRLEDEPLRVEVIAGEEVDEKLMMTPGDIAMMMNETSGLRVQVTSPSLGGASVRVQGLRGRYTQMLSDGLPLFGAQAGGLGLLQIPPMDLAQVEVIKGSASALYGAGALGGVVNLISKRPGEEPEHELLLNRSTLGGTDAVLFASAPLARGWGYTLLAGTHHQERWDVDDDAWTDLPGYRRVVVRPRLRWDAANGAHVFLTTGVTDESRSGGSLPGTLAPDGDPYPEDLDTRRTDVGLVGRIPLGAGFVTARGSWTGQAHSHRFGQMVEDDHHETMFAEASVVVPRERISAVFGAAFTHERYDNEDIAGFDYTFSTPAVFSQLEITPRPWLAATLSARVDAHSEYGTRVTPRLSTLLRAPAEGPFAEWTMRLSVGGGVFAPTPLTEEVEVVGLNNVMGFFDMRFERATTGSVDISGPLGPLEVTFTTFAASVRDAVTSVAVPPAFPGEPGRLELRNAPSPSRTGGIEAVARYIEGPWHLTANYAFISATEWDADAGERVRSSLVPRHALGAVGMYEVEDKGRIGLELYYTGEQHLDRDPYRTESEPYLIIGALFERQVGPVKLFVNFENITDRRQTRLDPIVLPSRGRGGRWTTDAWGDLAGRSINGGVRWRF